MDRDGFVCGEDIGGREDSRSIGGVFGGAGFSGKGRFCGGLRLCGRGGDLDAFFQRLFSGFFG